MENFGVQNTINCQNGFPKW